MLKVSGLKGIRQSGDFWQCEFCDESRWADWSGRQKRARQNHALQDDTRRGV